jgi:hypothetical protein
MNRHIAFILDRSGSMQEVKSATISGFNEYIASLKRDDPEATFQLALFDTEGIDLAEARKAPDVEPLNDKTYIPRANTPLWDAIGRVVSESQDNGDTAYLVVILTDGKENSSVEWDRKKLAALIKEKESSGRWTFAYLGSNQDAWLEAAQFGGRAGASMTYAANPVGTKAAYLTASSATKDWASRVRRGITSAVPDFFSGVTCVDCGEKIEAGKTHKCERATQA